MFSAVTWNNAANLQLRQRANLPADSFHHDVHPLHVRRGHHIKRLHRPIHPHARQHQILVHVDALPQEFQALLARLFPTSPQGVGKGRQFNLDQHNRLAEPSQVRDHRKQEFGQ